MIKRIPKEYIPIDFLVNADWKARMSEKAEELAQVITVEDALLLYLS